MSDLTFKLLPGDHALKVTGGFLSRPVVLVVIFIRVKEMPGGF